MKTLTIIDTFGFLFRSYYALPPLKSKDGFPTGLLTGFMNFILNIGKDFKTDYLVFALDSKGDTFRKELYSEYKSHRPEVPQDLLTQLPVAIDLISKMGFKTAICSGFEADDIIASLANEGRKLGLEIQIISHDKDLYQLIDDGIVYLFDPQKKIKIDAQKCFEKFGVYPCQFTDYQSLLGDSSDNVPGIKGIGKKTAESLIADFGTLENIYDNLDKIKSKRWVELLLENKEMGFLSKQLVTLRKDAHIIENLDDFILPLENPVLKVANILKNYDMFGILKKLNDNGLPFKTEIPTTPNNNQEKIFHLICNDEDLQILQNKITDNMIIAFDTETDSLNSKTANIIGFSLSFDEFSGYYIPISHNYLGAPQQISKDGAKKFIEFLKIKKLVFQNFKYDFEIIKNNLGIELEVFADTMILAWLNDSNNSVGLDNLSERFFDHQMIAFEDVVKKGETFAGVEVSKASDYAAEDAWMTRKLYFKLVQKLENEDAKLLQIAREIEYPFIYTILEMERNGIKIDTKFLAKVQEQNLKTLESLTFQIHELCEEKFNINSTKQLGAVLFERLKLPASKKTKTGYSTDEQALESIIDAHPVITKLLSYRELFKLKSTYIDPLLKLAKNNKNSRVFTSFLQTGTATGRLSSKNPNLQNIPVKSEIGRQIRQAFIADEGKVFIGIDYSQIELRLLAHFSQDTALVDAFVNGLDIHTQTAVKLFGENEASLKRNIAKSINFGLIYGMGPKKLSVTLGISTKEAKNYIDSYFALFPTVENFLQNMEKFVEQNGFAKTICGRKRVFDFANANGMQKAAFIREGVNALFQGSAADIIKLSMNKILKKYKNNDDIKMLLQIHDELIFEVLEEKAEFYKNEISNIMENILPLKVPLKVSANIAKSWGNLK